ncbi:MAG: hypothetical protein HRT89_04775, partial [Lentisphaeria bacterium]|nr:hypothetical protein [Lentisphaeria bacterium]
YKTDIYSLGITLYYAATGAYPIQGDTAMEIVEGHLYTTPCPLYEINPDLDPKFTSLVDRMLEKKREKRPDGMEIKVVLKDLLMAEKPSENLSF